ncbi:hypothetical protein BHM03_00039958 [Ensete ventricosum]|nr:hypothetical protein BHM03_00039958 [Ensete ventricosum]
MCSRMASVCRSKPLRRGSDFRSTQRSRPASTGGGSHLHRWYSTHGTIWWHSSGSAMGRALYRPETYSGPAFAYVGGKLGIT